ncbi:hypothetical protein [Clostridium saccharoperbutylacetonicum]|uniref:hypothetical protein n=1 Tax=Clostridium saccharoperbutylacetonicum TaxID=36745 RepID=UPI000983C4A2|nr:hypothetical protein [Clostridium saccharoperbutylacetonicum]AQR97256.1 hypothetical protein CLSAP_45800 [Clostridium saccharoperbutylacetonicum]NSB33138.1 putative membrane protein [Clostridium saccharoperbutylacetonicum]
MAKIFKYELKRLIINKFFFGLLIISAFYSHQVMCGDILIGVANTAPFSGWSYGEYLAKVLPVLLIALLFFISFLYSKQEKCVQALTKATPIDLFKFQMLRFGTIIIAFILISVVPIVYSVYFYSVNFHFIDFGSLLLPIVVTLLPAILFVFGLGVLGGRCHQGLIFILMAVVLLISFVPVPYSMDLFGGNFFEKYPASLDIVEPAFLIPVGVIIGKIIFCLSGLMMMLVGCIQKKK